MIYADCNASHPIHPEISDYLKQRLDSNLFANPNAIHSRGRQLLTGMEKARKICAENLGASPSQVFFNSGATEGLNTAFHSVLKPLINDGHRKTILVSAIEHHCIDEICRYWQSFGFHTVTLPVTPQGLIDMNSIQKTLKSLSGKVALVSVMSANNETGVIQPYAEIAALCQEYRLPFICDTCQTMGKLPIPFNQYPIDFAVLSGHKIGALTGTGILLVKSPASFIPFIMGAGQERGKRGGTQNYLGNETLAFALKIMEREHAQADKVIKARLEFEHVLKTAIPQTEIAGASSVRLPTTTMLGFPGIHSQALQIELESRNIFVTTTSACSDNEPSSSKTLIAMGYNDSIARSMIRISPLLSNAVNDYPLMLEALIKSYRHLSKISDQSVHPD